MYSRSIPYVSVVHEAQLFLCVDENYVRCLTPMFLMFWPLSSPLFANLSRSWRLSPAQYAFHPKISTGMGELRVRPANWLHIAR